ncbi:MAG TPA: surface-adhesin E family protein [Pyrinomonadaceae bacterium]|jgi:hypothetical protein|nr:surface-adhesin E family protein [Pyrinomonadaceae bacterium]
MKKAIFIALLMLLSIASVADLLGQSSKRKARTKTTTRQPSVSPCGVPIPSFAEFVEETKQEWRKAGETEDANLYYNTLKSVCDKGILKVWFKSVEKDTDKPLSYTMRRYEVNCRSNQLRLTSMVQYRKNGAVLDSIDLKGPDWNDPVPDSMGESIVEAVCHKTL